MIILTGASGGIGKEIIPYLLKFDEVIGLYNSTAPANEPTPGLHYEKVDLAKVSAIREFVERMKPKLSRLTIVHMAAVKKDGLLALLAEEDWDQMAEVNIKSNIFLTQALLPIMTRESWGRVIHIASTGGVRGDKGLVGYSACKNALFGISNVISKEYARFNITSNILVLGTFDSGMYRKLSPEKQQEILKTIPAQKLGRVSDIANAIEFLRNSEYVNNAQINIDGGL